LILASASFWRRAVLGQEDLTLARVDAAYIAFLVGLIGLLWTRWSIPLAWLKALELAMVVLLAGRPALVQFWLMLGFSRAGDVMLAQLTLKNVVLLQAVLILTYGLYVPKSWRRTAWVVGPLAVLPFAILALLALVDPVAMNWLWAGWKKSSI